MKQTLKSSIFFLLCFSSMILLSCGSDDNSNDSSDDDTMSNTPMAVYSMTILGGALGSTTLSGEVEDQSIATYFNNLDPKVATANMEDEDLFVNGTIELISNTEAYPFEGHPSGNDSAMLINVTINGEVYNFISDTGQVTINELVLPDLTSTPDGGLTPSFDFSFEGAFDRIGDAVVYTISGNVQLTH